MFPFPEDFTSIFTDEWQRDKAVANELRSFWLDLLEREAAHHALHARSSGKGPEWEAGFIAGLRYARHIISSR